MDKETIGLLSGLLVVVSAVPYGYRVYQGKIRPNITSWVLWSIIGLSLLLTYRSSGAKANVWPAVFGFTNPTIIAILAIWKKGDKESLGLTEKLCAAFCIVSLICWWYLRTNQNMVQFALYLAIISDGCAAIPTIFLVWRKPEIDRPFAWGMFAIAYGMAIFAISDHTIANYALPLWMFFGASSVTLPLAGHRIKNRMPACEWI